MLPGQRELKVSAVQGLFQLPDGPCPGRLAQDPLGPRALAVQEAQHVLVLAEVESNHTFSGIPSAPLPSSPSSIKSVISPHHDWLRQSALWAHGAEGLAEQAALGHAEGWLIQLGGGAAPEGPGDEGVPPFQRLLGHHG